MPQKKKRQRARELDIAPGIYAPGPYNAITDVDGVLVGHSTIIRGEGKHIPGEGPVRTGVTAILPRDGNVFEDRVVGGGFVLNGAGEVSGITQVLEWGVIETPILLTNTLSVGAVSESTVHHMVENYPEIGLGADVILPIVGECDDSWLNDIQGRHVRAEHVFEAIDHAAGGAVAEGNVGGGTGMITCGFKGGIGTSSRRLPLELGGFSLGALVMSNFGMLEDLRVDGVPVGRALAPNYRGDVDQRPRYGSIICVIATDAPLHTHQLCRLAKRAALGIGRAGSYAAHTSGEIVISFSTANRYPRKGHNKHTFSMEILLDRFMDPLYLACVETCEEAILNAMCMAEPMTGLDDHYTPALPLDEVAELVGRHRELIR